MEEVSHDDLAEYARTVLEKLKSIHDEHKGATILLLSGELGAGKTTFVQTLARVLGIEERVTSPTFLIQKEFQTTDETFHRLVHIDAYRLESFDELTTLGWDEISADPHTLIALEWPERVGGVEVFPDATHLAFRHAEEETRRVSLSLE